MYHDQGLIPFKIIHGLKGANITLGLPVLRLSVSHGTAFDAVREKKNIDISGFLYNIKLWRVLDSIKNKDSGRFERGFL